MALAIARLESRVGIGTVSLGAMVDARRAITFVFRGGLYYVLYISTTDYVIYDILSYTVSRGDIAYTGLDGR